MHNLSTALLRNINLTVGAGECICISGASGCGKSTLLRAIADLDPHEGEIYLDDVEHTRVTPQQWRRWVGLLTAESVWWFDTLRPHFPAVEQEWFAALGFDVEVLAWPVSRLSSGERQRLALLRLLCHKPRVLLLDEPTANLDSENSARMEALILRYSREHEAPLLWISHNPDQIRRIAKRHYRVADGQLQEVQP
jgi:ABC-type iron transport system FetAB ATPase subunit